MKHSTTTAQPNVKTSKAVQLTASTSLTRAEALSIAASDRSRKANHTDHGDGPTKMMSIRMPHDLVEGLKAYSVARGRPYQKDVKQILKAFLRSQPEIDLDGPLSQARDTFDRRYYEHHLAQDAGNVARLATRTGVERTALYRELKRLGVEPDSFRAH